jgi:hypothetical protein
MEGLIVQVHLDEHVPWIALSSRRLLLTVTHFHDLLGGDKNLTKLVCQISARDRVFERELGFVLIARVCVDNVPVHFNDPASKKGDF